MKRDGSSMRSNRNTHLMARIFMILFMIGFLVIMGRFMYIQTSGTVQGVSLEEWAKEKRNTTYYLSAERGRIFDRQGTNLAYDLLTYRVYAVIDETYSDGATDTLHVDNFEKTADELAPLLNVETSYIMERLKKGKEADSFQVEFGRNGQGLNQKKRDEIDELELPGIYFFEESIRHYPNGNFASHILGFARKQADQDDQERVIGVTGIEREFDELLRGTEGYISFQRDRFNRKLLNPEETVKNSVDGHDIYLTIDEKTQTLLEDVVSEVVEEYEPERLTAIVLSAKTGEVIAMTNRPSYNPNEPSEVENWYNDVISTPFEPGSTMKMFTWAAAIEAGVYNGDEKFKSGSYQINPRIDPINDHRREGWGSITFDEGFARSSNVAAAKLVWDRLGTEDFHEYLEAFDFDKKTNIDLPGEVPGRILFNWPIEKVTTAFGQGSTTTPMQQVKAATAFANDGKMLQPYVIDKIVHSETGEIIQENSPTIVGEPISKETAEQMRELLDSVVNTDYGTGQAYQLTDYHAIGKTGTSEIPDPEGPGYLKGHGQNIYSFLGMAPKKDPELIAYISVKQPKLEENEPGSLPVVQIFKSVMENGLHYFNIDPDRKETEKVKTVTLPLLKGEKTTKVEKELTEEGLRVTVVGDGDTVVEASVNQDQEVLLNDHVLLITDEPKMPDIEGWSLRDVLKLSNLLKLELEYVGNGYVTLQNLEEGSPLQAGDYLVVEFTSLLQDDEELENETDHKTEEKDEEVSEDHPANEGEN